MKFEHYLLKWYVFSLSNCPGDSLKKESRHYSLLRNIEKK